MNGYGRGWGDGRSGDIAHPRRIGEGLGGRRPFPGRFRTVHVDDDQGNLQENNMRRVRSIRQTIESNLQVNNNKNETKSHQRQNYNSVE